MHPPRLVLSLPVITGPVLSHTFFHKRINIFLSDQSEPNGEYTPQSIEDIADAVASKTGTVRARLSENVGKEGFWEKAGTGEYKYKDKEPEW